MIYYKTEEEIEYIRQSCLLVCKTLAHVGSLLKPGVTGKEVDAKAETFIRDHGAKPGFKGYRGFPATLCISKNEQVVHGIPDDVPFTETDILSIDCGTYMNDFFGDAAFTFAFGGIVQETMDLLVSTKASLYKGIEQAVVGNRIGDIGYAIQQHAEGGDRRYGVVRELVGHGIGRELHESPEVPNYGRRGKGTLMKSGLVIAIEPMINLGKKEIRQKDDGWTIITKDSLPSAHYEHTVAVRNEKADILSNHTEIEAEIKKNPELVDIN